MAQQIISEFLLAINLAVFTVPARSFAVLLS